MVNDISENQNTRNLSAIAEIFFYKKKTLTFMSVFQQHRKEVFFRPVLVYQKYQHMSNFKHNEQQKIHKIYYQNNHE